MNKQIEILESEIAALQNIIIDGERTEAEAIERINSELSGWFSHLLGVQNLSVDFSNDSTRIIVPDPNNRGCNEISIYHREPYTDNKRTYQLSWFSASADVVRDSNNYLEYLTALGRLANKLNNSVSRHEIINAIELSIAEVNEIRKSFKDTRTALWQKNRELETLEAEDKKEKILALVKGPVARLSFVTNHEYTNCRDKSNPSEREIWVSARKSVLADGATIINKGKGKYKVVFHEFTWSTRYEGDTAVMFKRYYNLDVAVTKNMTEEQLVNLLSEYQSTLTRMPDTATA